VLSTPFLDITDRVRSVRSEQGLLGLVFHPNYATNGYFYVNYTDTSSNTHISRFQVFSETPNLADPDSEVILLTIEQDFANHNGGDLNFGPDGYLYIGMGDGGSGGDPNNHAQTPTSLLGKMLRIDVDGATPYAIPPDNPFVDDPDTRDEIWAIGLRNPWRFSFDRLTDDLYIADVGQGTWEEIDLQPASSPGGENYGWSCYEGNNILKPSRCNTAITYTFPIHVYGHTQGNCSVTGGYVYRGSQYPALWGHYLFADYCSGRLWSLTPDGQGGWQVTFLNDIPGNPSTFGENLAGELFVAGHANGIIYRVVETDTPITGLTATNNSPVQLGKSVTLTATVETGDNIIYSWAFGDGTTGSDQIVTHTYATTGTFTAIVTASNTINLLTATTVVTILTPTLPEPPDPAIDLLKTVSAVSGCETGTSNLVVTSTQVLSPIEVTYCYVVQNSGNITFTTHTLHDDQLGSLLNNSLHVLRPGDVLTYTQPATVTQSITNVATWRAAADSFTATASAMASVTYIISEEDMVKIFLPVIFKGR
jgi:glucose/arabinose dehydrogenase